MKMPFGKHKGEDLDDLDTGYLRWIAENVTSDAELVREAEEQLTMREGGGRWMKPGQPITPRRRATWRPQR